MANENSFLKNTSLYIQKLTKQTYVEKTELLQLKNHLRKLQEQEPKYKPLLNKVTRIANGAKGKNPVTILNGIADDFKELQS